MLPLTRYVVSNSLRPHRLQHARIPCPPLSPGVLKFTSIESVMLSNHLILCRPLLLLPSAFSSIRVFSNESVLHIRWPKYWSFNFSINPSNILYCKILKCLILGFVSLHLICALYLTEKHYKPTTVQYYMADSVRGQDSWMASPTQWT